MTDAFLAQYSIRSKQDYIFRSNRILEIVGASAIIRDNFSELFVCAAEAGMKCQRAEGDFDFPETLSRFGLPPEDPGHLDVSELFTGGGNMLLLYRDRECFRRANALYTRKLLEDYPGLLPLCVGVPCRGNYDADYKALMAAVERGKNRMDLGRGQLSLPFAQSDRVTFQPLGCAVTVGGERRWSTLEAAAKRSKGEQGDKNSRETRLLDDMVTRRGAESLLAVVHADGNSMGAKIQKKLRGHSEDYSYCVSAMRRFTASIHSAFVTAGHRAVEECLDRLRQRDGEGKNAPPALARWIVSDGDDATFICNARIARDLTLAYLRGVDAFRDPEDPGEHYSSCAGVCAFHSHYPFARAYELAEQACDSAKGPVHEKAARARLANSAPPEQAWLDFHYIRSGVGGGLDEIRDIQGTRSCMGRPWFVCGDGGEDEPRHLERLDGLPGLLKRKKVVRGNIKALGAACEADAHEGELEWDRVCYRAGGLRAEAEKLFPEPGLLPRSLYDLSEMYDLWYQDTEEGDANGTAED